MKKVLTVTLFCLFALSALAGCGEKTQTVSGSIQTESEASAEKKVKDTIVWAQSGDINSFDFHVGKQPLTFDVTCNMFDTLVKWDKDMNIVPSLAESWEYLDDDSVRFKLRQDVTFHDGTKMTAADVKYTYDRAKDHKVVKNNFSWLDSTEVIDEYTVVINTKGSFSPVLNALTSPLAGIMPKHLMEKDENAMASHPVGTGPYKFIEWKEGEYVKMEANESYWGGAPKTKNLIMKVIPEASQRTVLLETGEIDIAYDLLPSDVEKLKGNSEAQVLEAASFKVLYFTVNCNSSNKALGSFKVRQAIEMAIDKQAICNAVMCGFAVPTGSNVAPGSFGFDEKLTANRYDPEKARALLKEAGYPDGFTLKLWAQPDQVYQETSVIVQNMLQEIGITVEIETMENQVMLDRMMKGEDFDLACSIWYNLMGDADYVLYSTLSPDSTSNFAHYNNQKVISLLMEGRAQKDDNARFKIYGEIYKILDEERPQIPLFAYENLVGLSSEVEGFSLSPITAHRYDSVVAYE